MQCIVLCTASPVFAGTRTSQLRIHTSYLSTVIPIHFIIMMNGAINLLQRCPSVGPRCGGHAPTYTHTYIKRPRRTVIINEKKYK